MVRRLNHLTPLSLSDDDDDDEVVDERDWTAGMLNKSSKLRT